MARAWWARAPSRAWSSGPGFRQDLARLPEVSVSGVGPDGSRSQAERPTPGHDAESVEDLSLVLAALRSGPTRMGMRKDELHETTESDFFAALGAPGLHVYTYSDCQVATTGTPEHVVALRGNTGRFFVSPTAVRCTAVDSAVESKGAELPRLNRAGS